MIHIVYIHDYTLPSDVARNLYDAQEAFASGDYYEGQRLISVCRQLLDKYLAGDNLVQDDDAYGFVKISDLCDTQR